MAVAGARPPRGKGWGTQTIAGGGLAEGPVPARAIESSPRWRLAALALLLAAPACLQPPAATTPPDPAWTLRAGEGRRWYRGNTHTHTLWSDGDAAPEVVVAWYKDHGYHFLCLSDHNLLSDGSVTKWQPVSEEGLLPPEKVQEVRERWGPGWVVEATRGGQRYMKLKTLPELEERFAEPGRFILIQGEEITCYFPDVHVNALNTRELILPVNSPSAAEAIRAAFAALEEQSARYRTPMLAHINHPNWRGGLRPEDIARAGAERFFEVYNGHPDVRNWGSGEHGLLSTDQLWDTVLALRLSGARERPLYGLATDDAHEYYEQGLGLANSGRGWVMVLAEELTAEAVVSAMKSGAFYASTGVRLAEIAGDGSTLRVSVDREPGVEYRVQFIGTLKGVLPPAGAGAHSGPGGKDKPDPGERQIGKVLLETTADPAVYPFQGNELYVRARVLSSKPHPNPFALGDVEMAWTQPVVPE